MSVRVWYRQNTTEAWDQEYPTATSWQVDGDRTLTIEQAGAEGASDVGIATWANGVWGRVELVQQ